MAELPSGTITFLFTDIEGSSALWEQYPEAMTLALARHDSLLREAIGRYRGHVFKTVGDAFCAAFANAPDALHAALAAHLALLKEQWGEIGPIRVRMGLHTGEAEERSDDYFGPTLNRVARLQGIGHGQQTLLSRATYALVCESLPSQVTLQDMAEHRLKDLLAPEHVWQMLHPDLPVTFPRLKSLDYLPTNLPRQTTSFIGREREIQTVQLLLPTTSLLTILGSGGSGKTRLALQIGVEALDDYKDGVWFVELAALSDPHFVPQAVASALGLREAPGISVLQTVREYLRDRRLLLILDNCEHLLGACAVLADSLLKSCSQLTLLATSRERLRIAGERSWSVPSLLTPGSGDLPLGEQDLTDLLMEYDAPRLFVERALLQREDFVLTCSNGPALASICRQLDGIPLAIELAPARIRSLSVEEIDIRLNNRFRLLTGGSRTAQPRQQTLRALIDWSYDLLNSQEKTLLCRLSIFAGGWTLEAAEAVGADAKIEDWEVLDLLTSLVDKSLVVTEQHDASTRYCLLETVRQYAKDRLAEQNEVAAVCDRHQAFFLGFAGRIAADMRGPERTVALRSVLEELENYRSALEWTLNSQKLENSAGLALAMDEFWQQSGSYEEGAQWLGRIIAAGENSLAHDIVVSLLPAAGSFHWRMGDYRAARSLLDRVVPLARSCGNARTMGGALTALANTLYYQGDFAASRMLYAECLDLARETHDEKTLGSALNNLALVYMDEGNEAAAQELFEEALALRRRQGNLYGIANVLGSLGEIAVRQGKRALARERLAKGLELLQSSTDKPLYAKIIRSFALLEAQEGNRTEAYRLMAECLRIRHKMEDKWGMAVVLEDTAGLIAIDRSAAACMLLAAAQIIRSSIGAPHTPVQRNQYEARLAGLHERLPVGAFERAWSEGSAWNADQALEHALSVFDQHAVILVN